MTRSIEELTRIQHLWADAGNPDAGVLADALEHVRNAKKRSPHEMVLANAFEVTLNANDFFNYASSDSVAIDWWDSSWIIPLVEEFGDDGVDAAMCYIAKAMPLPRLRTESFERAYKKLTDTPPKQVYSWNME